MQRPWRRQHDSHSTPAARRTVAPMARAQLVLGMPRRRAPGTGRRPRRCSLSSSRLTAKAATSPRAHAVQMLDRPLEILRPDVAAADDDQVLAATGDHELAVDEVAEIAGVEPAVLEQDAVGGERRCGNSPTSGSGRWMQTRPIGRSGQRPVLRRRGSRPRSRGIGRPHSDEAAAAAPRRRRPSAGTARRSTSSGLAAADDVDLRRPRPAARRSRPASLRPARSSARRRCRRSRSAAKRSANSCSDVGADHLAADAGDPPARSGRARR